MTEWLEGEDLVVFVDRAGYGFSEDTENEMTLSYIVEDYRKALQNAGIEAVVFVDGSQLCADAFSDEKTYEVGAYERILVWLAKLGFSRYVLRDYFYHYPDNYTAEEQALGDAFMLIR